MEISLKRVLLTQRCILRSGHVQPCDWNDFDPPEFGDRCSRSLYCIDGGPRDGEWVGMREAAEFFR